MWGILSRFAFEDAKMMENVESLEVPHSFMILKINMLVYTALQIMDLKS